VRDLSIVIASWNARDYLLKCLGSIERSPADHSREIIVVDNGSEDGSAEAVRADHPEVQLIHNEKNLGFAKANNQGVRASEGRYIALINSDIKVMDDCMDALVDYLDEHPDVGIAGPRILNANQSLQPSCRRLPSPLNLIAEALGLPNILPRSGTFMGEWAHDREENVEVLSGCFWIVRREALDTVGLLDEDFFIYGEDVDWCKRFADCGWRVRFTPVAQSVHYGGGSSANAPVRFFIEMQKANLHYWGKHYGGAGRFFFMTTLLLHQLLRLPVRWIQYLAFPEGRENSRHKIERSLACLRWLFLREAA